MSLERNGADKIPFLPSGFFTPGNIPKLSSGLVLIEERLKQIAGEGADPVLVFRYARQITTGLPGYRNAHVDLAPVVANVWRTRIAERRSKLDGARGTIEMMDVIDGIKGAFDQVSEFDSPLN